MSFDSTFKDVNLIITKKVKNLKNGISKTHYFELNKFFNDTETSEPIFYWGPVDREEIKDDLIILCQLGIRGSFYLYDNDLEYINFYEIKDEGCFISDIVLEKTNTICSWERSILRKEINE